METIKVKNWNELIDKAMQIIQDLQGQQAMPDESIEKEIKELKKDIRERKLIDMTSL